MSSPAAVLRALLTDATTYATVGTATCTAWYAAVRANHALLSLRSRARTPAAPPADSSLDAAARTLEGPVAAVLPLVASCAILFLFFFLGYIGTLLTALSAFTGFISLFFLLWPFAIPLLPRLRKLGLAARPGGHVHFALLIPPVVLVIAAWLLTGHWLANDALGVALCVLFASLCRVPSLRVATILFAGLFVYDIFFVFFSERFFGRNVMVEVATSTPVNPASAIASFLHLPIRPVERLAMPAKLVFPARDGQTAMLGLGDIILPEVLLVFLLEFDLRNRASGMLGGYFGRALAAYACGLVASFVFSYMFQAAQPALLYIVPAMLVPTLLLGRARGQLAVLWNGLPRPDGPIFADDSEAQGQQEDDPAKDQESVALIA